MALIKKPSELDAKSTLSAMIYGQPGIGKTTLAVSAPAPVLFDYDGGVTRINGAHQVDTVQIHNWENTAEALKEVANAGDTYKTIIIDTVGKMLAYMEDYIKRTQPKLKKFDGGLSNNGYSVRKQMFIQLLKDTSTMGKNIIFVSHEKEDKRDDITVSRPDISGSAANELVKELDLVGYMQAIGQQRTITFDPSERYYAKNTCNMPGIITVPVTVDQDGNAVGKNDFFAVVVANYKERQRENIATTKRYEALLQDIADNVSQVTNAKEANEVIKWLAGVEHIYNSPAKAWEMLKQRAAELGLKYNKIAKTYE